MKRKLVIGGLIAGTMVLGNAGPAAALWCGVADKPAGAGAVTAEKDAGNSGRVVFNGGFFSEPEGDFFVHGPIKVGFQNLGGLKHEQVEQGTPDHGVVHVD